MIHEFLNSDIVYDLMPFLPVLLIGLYCFIAGISIFVSLRIDTKKEASTHTMSEAEYIRFNDKRTGMNCNG